MPMQLRDQSMRRLPGRYQDSSSPIEPDRPAFIHKEVPFNPDLGKHCAFPSLPLDHPGPGPTEFWTVSQDASPDDTASSIHKLQPFPKAAAAKPRRAARHLPTEGAMATAAALRRPESESNPSQVRRAREHGPNLDGMPSLRDGPASRNQFEPCSTQRRATCASLPWRDQRGQSCKPVDPNVSSRAEAQTDQELGNRFSKLGIKPYTQWADLADSVKYIILYELTRQMSFVRAVWLLSLTWAETVDIVELIRQERGKKATYAAQLGQLSTAWTGSDACKDERTWLDLTAKVPVPSFITGTIAPRDIRRGREFLDFLCLNDIGARITAYAELESGEFYDIPLNHFLEDGWRDLPLYFTNSSDTREALVALSRAQRARVLERREQWSRELLVRFGIPLGTVHPVMLHGHGHGRGNDAYLDDRLVRMSMGIAKLPLHPSNYDIPGIGNSAFPLNHLPLVPGLQIRQNDKPEMSTRKERTDADRSNSGTAHISYVPKGSSRQAGRAKSQTDKRLPNLDVRPADPVVQQAARELLQRNQDLLRDGVGNRRPQRDEIVPEDEVLFRIPEDDDDDDEDYHEPSNRKTGSATKKRKRSQRERAQDPTTSSQREDTPRKRSKKTITDPKPGSRGRIPLSSISANGQKEATEPPPVRRKVGRPRKVRPEETAAALNGNMQRAASTNEAPPQQHTSVVQDATPSSDKAPRLPLQQPVGAQASIPVLTYPSITQLSQQQPASLYAHQAQAWLSRQVSQVIQRTQGQQQGVTTGARSEFQPSLDGLESITLPRTVNTENTDVPVPDAK